ncbi:hypothetical protein H4C80_18020 [Pseudomonas juntendi]|uniref:Uncharacterized protein n=1 Tax=Pseudomonas juntendi TaxID=2666183 RepID=A0A7W2KIC9_9PSED|nr:hypothetical protein [Pseudomonas juntendi]MBA6099006.1 hypothetical protein [Pseudomonas juntendi]
MPLWQPLPVHSQHVAEQLNGLQHNLFDVGFAYGPGKPHDLSSETLWQTELVAPSHFVIRCWPGGHITHRGGPG